MNKGGFENSIAFNLDLSPFIVYVELTKACDLVCLHCRAEAQPYPVRNELSTQEVFNLINRIKKFSNPPPAIVFTGGDPLKRPDLFKILHYSIHNNIRTCIAPSVTPLLTYKAIDKFKEIGIARIGISLDGADPQTHDKIRGIQGAYDKTIDIISYMDKINISLQINTSIMKLNVEELENLSGLLSQYKNIHMWSVFFLVPTGRGALLEDISDIEYEKVFDILYEVSKKYHYSVKTT
ncbi:MAG: radical SAM protein, partial [Planctomycetota bacterium]